MIFISYYDSPIGRMLIELEDDAVTGLWFLGQKYFPERYKLSVPQSPDSPDMLCVKRWLDRYFSAQVPDLSELRLKPDGSEFRRSVWEILCRIPYGHSMSYGEIAKILESKSARRMSAQAVGGAVGHNPISVIIPCHRVLGSDGSLTGYAGGLERKLALLRLEKII